MKYRWQCYGHKKYLGWRRDRTRCDIMLAVLLQARKKKIHIQDVISVLGLPNVIEGTLTIGCIFYYYRNPPGNGDGTFAHAYDVYHGVVVGGGTNKIDQFNAKITRRHLIRDMCYISR